LAEKERHGEAGQCGVETQGPRCTAGEPAEAGVRDHYDMKKSIPYIILLSFILFFLYKKGSNDAYQLNSDFNMNAVNLDVAKRTFPLVFNNTEYNSFEYSTLKVKNEIFLVRYRL
jgi:hypothetical protein